MTTNLLQENGLNNREQSMRGSDRMLKMKRRKKHVRKHTVKKQQTDFVKLDLDMLSLLI